MRLVVVVIVVVVVVVVVRRLPWSFLESKGKGPWCVGFHVILHWGTGGMGN